jgi:ABC-type transport system substrate-binding protein
VFTLSTEHREADEVLRTVLTGDVDLVADGEAQLIPRERLEEVKADGRFKVWIGPGSGVTFLALNTRHGPFAERANRLRFAGAVNRDELVRVGELGYAEPSRTLFRAGYAGWPTPVDSAKPPPRSAGPLKATLLLAPAPTPRERRGAELLRTQAAKVSIDLRIDVAGSTAEFNDRSLAHQYDAIFMKTHGTPYDPWISMYSILFDRGPNRRPDAEPHPTMWTDATLQRHLLDAFRAGTEPARRRALQAIQSRLEEEMPLIPLFIPQRIAVSRAGLTGFSFGMNGYNLGLGRVKFGRVESPSRPR